MLIAAQEISYNVGGQDRRSSDRFPIERDLRFKVIGKGVPDAGSGKTVNISSNGVLFDAAQPLLPGRRLEISISWPAQLNGRCLLKLVAKGRVVRSHEGRTAVEIQQYEFRTQASQPLLAR